MGGGMGTAGKRTRTWGLSYHYGLAEAPAEAAMAAATVGQVARPWSVASQRLQKWPRVQLGCLQKPRWKPLQGSLLRAEAPG